MRRTWLILLALAAVVGALWSGAPARAGKAPFADDPPSPVIYPGQRLPLLFTHAAHLERGAACVDCHRDATTSRSAVDNLLPGEAACRGCHAIDRTKPDQDSAGPPVKCVACHVGYVAGQPPARVYIPSPELKFDHASHVARGQACTDCHGDLAAEGVGLATRDQLPRMRLCLTCHDGEQAPDACATCHLTEVGVLRTELGHGTLVPSGVIHNDAHGLDFIKRHGAAASRDPDYCGACHRDSDCADCHAGVAKPMDFHGGDYVLTHAVEARRNQPDCSTCHRKQTFCTGCHDRSGVGSRGESDFEQADPMRAFHPDNWVSLAGGANQHAREARANLDACASCHREDDCAACHTAELGSPRVSPHGAGWRSSSKCEALASKNPRMCLRCHIEQQQVSCD